MRSSLTISAATTRFISSAILSEVEGEAPMHFACAAKLLAGSGNPALTVLTNFRDTTLRTGFIDNSPGK
jgi:hypothetical protein